MRPIPEILGYHLDWPDGCANYKVWWKDGNPQPLGWRPSDGDLVDWLTGPKDKNVSIEARRQSKWGGSLIVQVTVERRNASVSFLAPSLRLALEEAVHAVDEFDSGHPLV